MTAAKLLPNLLLETGELAGYKFCDHDLDTQELFVSREAFRRTTTSKIQKLQSLNWNKQGKWGLEWVDIRYIKLYCQFHSTFAFCCSIFFLTFFSLSSLVQEMCLLHMLSIVIFDRRGTISTNWQQLQKMEPKRPKKGKESSRTWTTSKKKWIWCEINI